MDEARLTFLAVRRWYGWRAGRLLVLDIGGGSLEMAAGDDEAPDIAISLPLGAGRLTRGRFSSDPPPDSEVRALRKQVRAEIAEGRRVHRARGAAAAWPWATSKTFRQLARITGAAPSQRRTLTSGASSPVDDLRARLPKLAAHEARPSGRRSPGSARSAPRRLVAGALVAEAALDLLDLPTVEIGPWALREGVILRRLDSLRDGTGSR